MEKEIKDYRQEYAQKKDTVERYNHEFKESYCTLCKAYSPQVKSDDRCEFFWASSLRTLQCTSSDGPSLAFVISKAGCKLIVQV